MTYKELVNIIRDAAEYVNPNGTFLHGRKTDASLDYNEPSPYIFLLEPRPLPQSNNSKYVINISFPIIFVGQDSPESTELQREDLKQEMSILAMQLLSRIDQNDNLENVRFESPEPEIRQMAGTLTGFSFSLALTYNTNDCTINVDLPPSIKLFANETNVASGTEIELAWIAENVNQVNISGLGVLQGSTGVVNVVVNNTETFVGSATNSAGTSTDSITITVGSACEDTTAVLKDTAGNILSTTDIPSGDSEDIIAPDGSITNSNSDASYVNNVSVRSGQLLKANELPDINLIVNDQNGNNLLNVNRPSVKNLTEVVNVVTALTVDFSANDTTPETNQTITFNDLTVGASQWQWDFGDGNTSTLQNPTHSYKYAGNYTVTLCATNGSISGKEVKSNYIAVTLQSIPTTTLQAWYKAPVGATPSNLTLVSGAISQWNDDSGNGYNLVQGTAVSRPLYSVTEITSPDGTVYGGGTFDGTNDFLSNISAGFTRGTTSTMFMLFKQNSIASGTRVVFAAQNGLQGVSNLASNPQFRMISGSNIDTLIAYPLMNYFVVKFQYSNAGNASIKINNLIARAIVNTGASTDVGIVIGGNIAGTAQSNITFVEGAIYSTALSAPNETSILNYFSSKFGLW
jgi:PKD repeat protein